MTDLSNLKNQITEAQSEAALEAEPVTIADIAAAAITALEFLAMILPPNQSEQLITVYELRAEEFRAAFEQEEETA